MSLAGPLSLHGFCPSQFHADALSKGVQWGWDQGCSRHTEDTALIHDHDVASILERALSPSVCRVLRCSAESHNLAQLPPLFITSTMRGALSLHFSNLLTLSACFITLFTSCMLTSSPPSKIASVCWFQSVLPTRYIHQLDKESWDHPRVTSSPQQLGIRMRRVCLAQKNIRNYASRYPL